MKIFEIEYIAVALGFVLLIIGIWGIISRKNIISMIIGFSIVDTSIHLLLVSIGYIKDRTAPIIGETVTRENAAKLVTDPVPQALVLTAIVIGVGITALMLTYALKLYRQHKSLEISTFNSLKW